MKEENNIINTSGAIEKVEGKEEQKDSKKERVGNDRLRTAALVGTAAAGSAAVTAALSLDDDADLVEADELLEPEEEQEQQEAVEAHSPRANADIPEATAVPVEGDVDEIEVVNPDDVMIDEEQPVPQASVEEQTPIEPEAPAEEAPEAPAEIPADDVDIDDIM